MIFYSEQEFKGKLKIEVGHILGKPKSIKEQLRSGSVGSELYRLIDLRLKSELKHLIDLNTRCNFEKYEKGLLLRINHNQKLYFLAFSYEQITSISVVKGKEIISPLIFSPMRFLLFMGVHIRYARYFRISLSEYRIERMNLIIKLGEDIVKLDSNGYNYYSELNFFKAINNQNIRVIQD